MVEGVLYYIELTLQITYGKCSFSLFSIRIIYYIILYKLFSCFQYKLSIPKTTYLFDIYLWLRKAGKLKLGQLLKWCEFMTYYGWCEINRHIKLLKLWPQLKQMCELQRKAGCILNTHSQPYNIHTHIFINIFSCFY